jgi:uncharacterized protein YndB with AHSA1/START domain
METANTTRITVETTVKAPVDKAWKYFTLPEHVTKWNQASDDWHTPSGTNDLRVGGSFAYRMEAKDGSFGFDFGGVYDEVTTNKSFAYTMGDGRKVEVSFKSNGNETTVTETFDAEGTHSVEMQKGGWQAILDSYRKYTEAN